MKILFVDVETTGIDYQKNDIWQIAAIMEIDGQEVDSINLKFQPPKDIIVDPEIFKTCKITNDELFSFPMNSDEAYEALVEFLNKHISRFDKEDKAFICGYNSTFDIQFLRQFFIKHNNNFYGSYFYPGSLDLMVLCLEFLKDIRQHLPNFKLETLYQVFTKMNLIKEIDGNAHDAFFDIKATKEIYNLLRTENICSTLNLIKELNKSE